MTVHAERLWENSVIQDREFDSPEGGHRVNMRENVLLRMGLWTRTVVLKEPD